MRKIDSGVCSEGFSTQVLPKAKLEAICMLAKASGAFHGANKAATPAGWRVTVVWYPDICSKVSPAMTAI